jgi:periplasmic protein TonB
MRAAYNTGMSIAGGIPRGVLLPADPDFRENRERAARNNHLRRSAIIAAALAHAVVITAMIVDWPMLFPITPLERPPIPVTLVMEPPPPPPPQAKPTPPPAPPQPQQRELVSGVDQTTTAPPPSVEKAEDAAPKPASPPPLETQAKAAPPEAKPATQPDKARQEKPKLAKREATPKPSHGVVNRAPGERETAGDPYLNLPFSLIEAHRSYPPNAVGSLGLPLEGTAVYLIRIRSDGALTNIALERSSGAEILDRTALRMIQQAAPFPPPPKEEFPGPGVVLEVTIHLFPGMG